MKYAGYRCQENERAGCVDFLGVVEAFSINEAESYFLKTFDWDENCHLDVQEEEATEEPCPVIATLSKCCGGLLRYEFDNDIGSYAVCEECGEGEMNE